MDANPPSRRDPTETLTRFAGGDDPVEAQLTRGRRKRWVQRVVGGALVVAAGTLSAAMLAGPGSSLARGLGRLGLMPGREAALRAAEGARRAAREAFEVGDVEHLERAESLYALALEVQPEDADLLADRLLAAASRAALLGRLAQLDLEDARAAADPAVRARLEARAVARNAGAGRARSAMDPSRRAFEHRMDTPGAPESAPILRAIAAIRALSADRRGAASYLARAQRLEARAEDPWTAALASELALDRAAGEGGAALAAVRARLAAVLARHPGYVGARLLAARLALADGDQAGAEAELDRVLRLEPTSEEALRLVARLRAGHPPAASLSPTGARTALVRGAARLRPVESAPVGR